MRVFLGLLCILVSLVSCRVRGDTVFARIDTDGRLYGPWHEADWDGPILHRPPSEDAPLNSNEVVQVYLDTVFLKYLPDAGVNEVVIVAQVSEDGSSNDPVKNYTRVLGPYEDFRDGRMLGEEGILVYGPKRLKGDSITIKFDVIEVDADGKDDATAVFDLIGSLAGTFNVANPLGAAEVQLATGLGKTLIELNANDVVISRKIHLYAKDTALPPSYGEDSSPAIPLRPGSYALITQELGYVGKEFFWFLRKEADDFSLASLLTWPLALVADVLLLPWNAGQRVFLDAPDHDSLVPLLPELEGDKVKSLREGLDLWRSGTAPANEILLEPTHRWLTKNGERYESKSWLVFSVRQGGDPSRWALREEQRATEDQLRRLFEDRSASEVLPNHADNLGQLLQNYVDASQEAERLARESQAGLEVPTQTSFFDSDVTGGATQFLAIRPPGTTKDNAKPDVVTYTPDRAIIAAALAAAGPSPIKNPAVKTYGDKKLAFEQQLDSSSTARYVHELLIQYGSGESKSTTLTVLPKPTPVAMAEAWHTGTAFELHGIPDASIASIQRVDLKVGDVTRKFGRRLLNKGEEANALSVKNEESNLSIAEGDTFRLRFDGGLDSIDFEVLPALAPAITSGNWAAPGLLRIDGVPTKLFSLISSIDYESGGSTTTFGVADFSQASGAMDVNNGTGVAITVNSGDTFTFKFNNGLPDFEYAVP